MNIHYGSVCSGIEAASVAWHPLGWRADWLAEIDRFASTVLAHHYPDVPNLGDMTKIAAMVRAGFVPAPDVLVGGTPCQAFSIAGLRGGLSDPRGALTIAYVDLANAIDTARSIRGELASVIVWENVPGVLSSKDNAFGCFLGALAGEDSELQPAGGRWSNAGCVLGPQRAIAWRVIDAQYTGVAQRRRRVFVVASARKDFDPAEVLFEFEGVRRDIAPSREAGEKPSSGTGSGAAERRWPAEISSTLDTTFGTKQGLEDQHVNAGCPLFVPAYAIHGTQDPDIRIDQAHALGRNSGQENAVCVTGDITHTLKAEAFDASEDGTGRGQPIVAAFAENSRAELRYENGDGSISGALSAGGGKPGQSYPVAQVGMAVRRLTPRECERLQGFPDDWTLVPVRRKPAADGPRYKALGNSMAVPCMHFIGERIDRALSGSISTPKNTGEHQ